MGPLRARRPTMRDVAAEAGVSLKTVSRVVNKEGGVRPDVVARVNAAIGTLGYQRDDRARYLRMSSRETRTIGFIQVDVANPFFSAIFRGLEDVAIAHGYQVLAGSSDGDPDRQDALLRTLIARRVDGIILVPSGDRLDLVAAEIARKTPVVFLDLEPPDLAGDIVRSDHRGGAAALTEHLLVRGHTAIAYLGDDLAIFSSAERFAGFRAALAAAGLDANDAWIHHGLDDAGSHRAVCELFAEDEPHLTPTAIISAQNLVTLGAVRALHDLELQHQIAHVGFDDIELGDVVTPGITVMPQNPRHLGATAGEQLIKRLRGDSGPPLASVHRNEIIERGSGEIAPRT